MATRIRRIETFRDHLVGVVRVTTEDGAAGWGVEIGNERLRRAANQISEGT